MAKKKPPSPEVHAAQKAVDASRKRLAAAKKDLALTKKRAAQIRRVIAQTKQRVKKEAKAAAAKAPAPFAPFSSKRRLTPDKLKAFRAEVAKLKKKGVALPNARTVQPYQIKGGKTVAEIVNEFHRERVLLPLKTPVGFSDLPLKHKSVALALAEMEADPARFDAMKKDDEWFAFSIDGMRSWNIYSNMELLLEDLQKYKIVEAGPFSRELYGQIKIIRWNKNQQQWKPEKQTYTPAMLKRAREKRTRNRHKKAGR